MRIMGKNKKGQKVLITVPDWDIPIIGGVENNGSNASGSAGNGGGGSNGLLTNLTAYYSFDSQNGNDSHTNSYNVVDYGGTINWKTGKNGYALDSRNSLNQQSYFRDAVSPAPATTYFDFNNKSYTISCWFKEDTTDEGAVNTHYMVGWHAYGGVDIRLTNNLAGGLVISLNHWNGSAWKSVSGGIITKDVWNHVVGRYNSSTDEMKITVNGTTAAPATGTGAASVTINPRIFFIGNNPYDGSNLGYAYIDEVAVWYKYLSDTDVSNLYNSGTGLFYSSFTA